MAITGHRNALGDITKQQNLPKNAAAKDALVKVNLVILNVSSLRCRTMSGGDKATYVSEVEPGQGIGRG